MKNIYILATNKASRLLVNKENTLTLTSNYYFSSNPKNIYITSNEEIKEADWFINIVNKKGIVKCENIAHSEQLQEMNNCSSDKCKFKKIILTTDIDLVKDGVQEIPDDFLEWFVQNSSCESVEVIYEPYQAGNILQTDTFDYYKIIIPKNLQQIIDEDFSCGLVMGQLNSKSESKQFVERKCSNALQFENCVNNCAHGLDELKQKTVEVMEKQTENLHQCGNYSKSLLVAVKYAYHQYKNDLNYVKNVSGIWYGKPYKGLITRISIAWHNLYWHVLKR